MICGFFVSYASEFSDWTGEILDGTISENAAQVYRYINGDDSLYALAPADYADLLYGDIGRQMGRGDKAQAYLKLTDQMGIPGFEDFDIRTASMADLGYLKSVVDDALEQDAAQSAQLFLPGNTIDTPQLPAPGSNYNVWPFPNNQNAVKNLPELDSEQYNSDQLQKYIDSNGVNTNGVSTDYIIRFCGNDRGLAESLIDAIPESYPDQGLSLLERVEKYNLPEIPDPQSLSAYQTRLWYTWQESLIPERLDYSQPLSDVARQAYEMRNELRTTARESMADSAWAEYLMENEPNWSFNGLITYYTNKGIYGEELWNIIIKKSTSSRGDINKLFGL